jgi:hypothetical protein
MRDKASVTQFRSRLRIDRADLDGCLMEQPELYYHVAEAHAFAVARRDRCKVDYEEAVAKHDDRIRSKAADEGERMTDTRTAHRIALVPEVQSLQRQWIESRAEVESLLALKEAFQQRSFMLRELVAWAVAHQYDLVMERGGGSGRAALAEAAGRRIAKERERKRKD